jgi:hypothetical protein
MSVELNLKEDRSFESRCEIELSKEQEISKNEKGIQLSIL